jgi:hypothetical protein
MYAHEELIDELGLTTDELSSSLRGKLRTFNNKKRLSSKPESVEKLKEDSEILADEIAEWYAEQEDLFDDNDLSESEKKENIVSHISNNDIEDDKKEIIEEKTSGFGLGFLGKW